MTFTKKFYPESQFGGFSDIDGTITFYNRVNSLLTEQSTVLDVGCGRGEYQDDEVQFRRSLRILRGKCKKVIGIDVDINAKTNPYIDEFFKIEGDVWKEIKDGSIDVVVCDYVLEHAQFPDRLFSEFNRVLKPGGVLCARTPNLLSYLGIAASLIPDRFHAKLVGVLQDARKPEDVFPKFYRCNTIHTIRRLFRAHNFEGVVYGFESEPAYFSFSSFVYGIFTYLHPLTPPYFRTILYLFARKK